MFLLTNLAGQCAQASGSAVEIPETRLFWAHREGNQFPCARGSCDRLWCIAGAARKFGN